VNDRLRGENSGSLVTLIHVLAAATAGAGGAAASTVSAVGVHCRRALRWARACIAGERVPASPARKQRSVRWRL
jgi:hypothetical protein